jgi:FkbM family methyltransferase
MLISIIAAVYRRLPITSGLTRFSFNKYLNRIFRGAPPTVTAHLRDGTPIEVDPQDYHGRILYLFGSNDIKVTANAVALLKAGDVFLDIGANYSTVGLAASHSAGPSGAVHLFEPQKRIADPVEAAIAAGGYRNVQLHRLGLMDVDGSFTIRGPANHSGRATFVDHEDSANFVAIEECQVRAIDAYATPLVAGKSFGAKLDIEGSEPKVMPWLLAQPNLRFLIFEAAHHHQELYDEVRSSGLTLYGLDRTLIHIGLTRIDDFKTMRNFHDLLAVRLSDSAKAPAKTDPRALAKSPLYI